MWYMVRLVNSTGMNPLSHLFCCEIGSVFISNAVWHTVTEKKAFAKSMGFSDGASFERKEGTYVSIRVWTGQCLLHAGRRSPEIVHHQVSAWSPWRKAPKQGSTLVFAVGSLSPQAILVSQYIAFVYVLMGTLYMTVIYRMYHLVHVVIESPLCSAWPLLSINMEHKYVDTLHSSNAFSPDVLVASLPILCFLIPCHTARHLATACEWVDVSKLLISSSNQSGQTTAQRFAIGENLPLSVSFQNIPEHSWNTTAVHFRLVAVHCAEKSVNWIQASYSVFSKPSLRP